MPTTSNRSAARSSACRGDTRSCAVTASVIWSRTRMTGFSAFIALCVTSEISFQRSARRLVAHGQDVFAVKPNVAVGDRRRRTQQAQDRLRDGRLAAARFPGQAVDLARPDPE